MRESTSPESELDFEFLGEDSLSPLNYQQRILFHDLWSDLIEFIRERGKNPKRNRGYSASNVRPIARRIFQAHQYHWDADPSVFGLGWGCGKITTHLL